MFVLLFYKVKRTLYRWDEVFCHKSVHIASETINKVSSKANDVCCLHVLDIDAERQNRSNKILPTGKYNWMA